MRRQRSETLVARLQYTTNKLQQLARRGDVAAVNGLLGSLLKYPGLLVADLEAAGLAATLKQLRGPVKIAAQAVLDCVEANSKAAAATAAGEVLDADHGSSHA